MIPTKINIGCGYDKRAGYLNVDSHPGCEPDLLITDNDLSGLPQAYFEEVIALDVLEHIPRAEMMSALYDWVQLLRPGGRFFVQTSSIFGIIDVMRRAGDFETIHNWKRCLFGNQAHPGDWHYNGFTEQTLTTYLRAVGLAVERIGIHDDWLLEASATRVDDFSDLAAIEDYSDFVMAAYDRLLGREPEPFKLAAPASVAFSPERKAEIKGIATSEERLYKLGAHKLASPAHSAISATETDEELLSR